MRLQSVPKARVMSIKKYGLHSNTAAAKGIPNSNLSTAEFVSRLLNRRWALSSPDTKIHQILIRGQGGGGLHGNISFQNNTQPCLGEGTRDNNHPLPSFYVVRDDLLHPLVNGNKARKLDALIPLLLDNAVTDVVTCGGCQSAHAAAVAVSCAERGLKSHLLLRGEEPASLTGYNLISKLYGNVSYIPRSIYSRREEMLTTHAELVAGNCGSIVRLSNLLESSFSYQVSGEKKPFRVDLLSCTDNFKRVAIINEGAGDAVGLLGVMRLVQHLSQDGIFGKEHTVKIVVDAGTGTTAVGLGIAALCLGLPWEVHAVMLADKIDGYRKKEESLISELYENCPSPVINENMSKVTEGVVHWVERRFPRKFGNILEGEVEECQKIAQQTGIMVDPVYTLAAWDLATQLSQRTKDGGVVMLHTGGMLGMFGLANRYKSHFQLLQGGV